MGELPGCLHLACVCEDTWFPSCDQMPPRSRGVSGVLVLILGRGHRRGLGQTHVTRVGDHLKVQGGFGRGGSLDSWRLVPGSTRPRPLGGRVGVGGLGPGSYIGQDLEHGCAKVQQMLL